jgi:hypothetical protein
MSPPTVNIALKNASTSSNVYAYITGRAESNNALFLLQQNGHTPYFPSSPGQDQSPLLADCGIRLGGPNSTVTVVVPHIYGARIWLSIDGPLTFKLNRGPALVEPSVTNPSDPNYNLRWGFAEFTFNNKEIFANISYVDFVSLPISMTLLNGSGRTQHVSGMGTNGLDMVWSGLRIQESRDHAGWEKLIIKHPNGSQLRALSPNSGIVMNPSLFSNYYQSYVERVWNKYRNVDLRVNTQAQWGILTGRVHNDILIVGGQGFTKPTAHDIFSCSTGPFTENGSAERAAIIPRLAAAFNRSTLMIEADNIIPDTPPRFYFDSPTNHYSRIVHEANIDRKGYAFPYDDVTATGQPNVAGTAQDGDPRLLTLAVGGNGVWMRAHL